MKTKEALKYFGNNQSEMARALGYSRGAVWQWLKGRHLPEGVARRMAALSGGKLEFNEEFYAKRRREISKRISRGRKASLRGLS